MDFPEPNGRIIVNSPEGFTKKIKETERNSYIFPDIETCKADTPRQYRVGDNVLFINPFSEILGVLNEINW